MDRLSKLVTGIALAVACISAHAGYAQLAPPPGFAPMPAAAPVARYGFAAANEAAWVNQTVRTTASLNVGGQAVKMPVAMRLAANAPRFAAAAIYAHPGLRAALGIATLLSAAKVFWDASDNQWKKITDGEDIVWIHWRTNLPISGGPDSACKADWPGSFFIKISSTYGQCRLSSGTLTYVTGRPTSNSSTIPLTTPGQFIPAVINPANNPGWPSVPADWPMPSTVPQELPPGTPLPVEQPVINPTPGDNPQPQPYFVPQGDPVPNPNYKPELAPSPQNQPYIIPGVRIVPSPTPDEPLRVDVQPVNRPTADPKPLTPDQLNPQPEPNTDPNTQPDPSADDKPKPEEQQSLCEKHPDILACQKLDNPEDKNLDETKREISITPDSGWGADSAACPAPKTLDIQGHQIAIPYDLFCQYMSGLRPIIIAMAWLSAAFILLGVRETS